MNPNAPFSRSYWAVLGRILAGCCPGGIDPLMLDEEVRGLVDAGVTLVVNLREVSETELFGRFFEPYESSLLALGKARGHTIRMEHFPIKDRSIPTTSQMEAILQSIRKETDAGGVVYVHCMGGIGRTGTVIGCYLADQGHPNPLEALADLTQGAKDYFWPTPQTQEQREFVTQWGSKPYPAYQ